ncbi:MAG: hypothetical protein QXN26_02060 [Thermoplasmataceae archaeon]
MADLIISGNLKLKNLAQVTWSWYDKSSGTIMWTFRNPSARVQSIILFRSGYYFGNAYWPIYLANQNFNVRWGKNDPLVNLGSQQNSPPLGVVNFNSRKLVCFIFTMNPGQDWSMLEGGFQGTEPESVKSVPVSYEGTAEFCIAYDKNQVNDWDLQTGTGLKGYNPNPSTFSTAYYGCRDEYYQLFNDTITAGKC